MNINILITSAGKRVTLTKQFQETLRRFYPEAKVFTTDMNPAMAPAGIVSDGCITVPRVTDSGYIEMLLTICKEKGIRIIVPTIDTELLVLAENKELFQENGIEPMVSELSFIQACRDKRNTGTFLNSHDIRVPAPVDKYHPTFPLFAKPYDGSLSKDLYVVRGKEELTSEILNHPKLIFMEYIDKQEYKEFTVDMYYGKDNRVKARGLSVSCINLSCGYYEPHTDREYTIWEDLCKCYRFVRHIVCCHKRASPHKARTEKTFIHGYYELFGMTGYSEKEYIRFMKKYGMEPPVQNKTGHGNKL